MSKRILDSPFEDDFPILFEKGETILWQGRQVKNLRHKNIHPLVGLFKKIKLIPKLSNYLVFIFFFVIVILSQLIPIIFSSTRNIFILLTVIFVLIYYPLVLKKVKSIGRKKFKYYLTQHRLIIHPSNRKNKQFHIFNLNDITNVQLIKSGEFATITFQVIDQPTTDILFRKEVNGNKKMFGRIEGVKNGNEVVQFMKREA